MKEISHDGLAWEMKLWVDEQDKVFSKIDAKVIADGCVMKMLSGRI